MKFFSLIVIEKHLYDSADVFVIMLEKINTNEKLRIVIVKEYQRKSTVKGFHVYKEIWNPVKGKFWTLE